MTAVVGLALLVLLPGLLVVRAPWCAVPALSLAFWALSPWWSPAWLSRASFVSAVLVASLALLVLRLLPKHEVPPPPGWVAPVAPARALPAGRSSPPFAAAPSLLTAATAAVLLLPLPAWRNAPGARLAFQTTAAQLVLWRDGIPLSSEPLLPLASFGAHAPALATLSADVSRVCGVPPARAVAVVLALGVSLLLLGLFSLVATGADPASAAASSPVAVAAGLVPIAVLVFACGPSWLDRWGAGEAIVALAFLLAGAALVVGHDSRSSGLAAAWLVASGMLVHPLLALLVLVACAMRRGRRAVVVGGSALLLAAPGLVPLARALSAGEAWQTARAFGGSDLLAFLWLAIVAASVVALTGRLARARARTALAVGALASLALVASLHGWLACGQLSASSWQRLRRAGESTGPLQTVCVEPALRDWAPAISGRAAAGGGTWAPPAYADELQKGADPHCPEAGHIVSREAGKPFEGSGVLIDRRGGGPPPTR